MNHVFFVAIIVVAGCLPSASVFSQVAVHGAFKGLSPEQVRSEFEDYEKKGKKCDQGAYSPFQIELPARPKKVELDPDRWILAEGISTKELK